MLGYEHLHFGYWQDLELHPDNVEAAQRQYVVKLIRHIPRGTRTILDVGCGAGALADELVKLGYEVEGLAPDPKLIEKCRERLGDRALFQVSTFEEFETDRRFDLILMSESCQYIQSRACASRSRELLDPGGCVLICDMFRHRPSPRDKPYISSSGHNIDRFLGHMAAAGLELELRLDITEHTGPTLDLFQNFLSRQVLPVVDSAVEVVQRGRPWLFRIGRLLLARTARHIRKKYEHQGLDVFREYKFYLTLRFRLPEATASVTE